MKISIVVIVALCVATCASKPSARCKCVRTDLAVDPNLIIGWTTITPKPYCKKIEVIVTLKEGRTVCIDPNGEFYRLLVETVKAQRMAKNAARKSVRTIAPSPSLTASVQTLQTTATVTPAASTKE